MKQITGRTTKAPLLVFIFLTTSVFPIHLIIIHVGQFPYDLMVKILTLTHLSIKFNLAFTLFQQLSFPTLPSPQHVGWQDSDA